MVEDLVIIGSGPAGLTAALYSAREGFNPIVLTGTEEGGQLMLTNMVDNFPGFPKGILGSELMDLMKDQAKRFGARIINDSVIDVDFSSRSFTIKTNSSDYKTRTVIIATGASARMLGIDSEKKFMGRGLSTCATCNAAFFKNKNVIVVGGGDTAMEDSLFLTRFAKSVTIIHRRDAFRASKIMQDKVLSNNKIKVLWDSGIEELLGDKTITRVKIKNYKTNARSEMAIDGVFLAIGNVPNTSFLKGKIKLDGEGYILTKDEVKTDIDGVFVAGDVADHLYKQAVTAASSGTKAALEARSYLQKTF